MRGAGAPIVVVVSVLAAAVGCSRDPLPRATIGTSSSDGSDGSGDGGGGGGSRDGLFGGDLGPVTPDFAHLPCLGADQPAKRVTGQLRGQPFTARTGVAGWQYGDGCSPRALVYLYEGALPTEEALTTAPALWIEDKLFVQADLGATREVVLYWRPDPNVDITLMSATVEWLKHDEQNLQDGALEGILTVNKPGWMLSGHFIANHCPALDEVCL